MIKNFRILALFFALFFLTSTKIFAQSNYVLPYPSSMPGSLSYKIHIIYENFSKYWYFGDFGQFDYNLKLADKYLVEAKTLFEYKQYLLGYNALKKSDQYFVGIIPSLAKAEEHGKNILQKKLILNEAARKHMEVLREMEKSVPGIFIWEPEKSAPTTLDLKTTIDKSINLRQKNV